MGQLSARVRLSTTTSGKASRRCQFQKRSQLFIGMHNETFSIVAMRVSNTDCFPRSSDKGGHLFSSFFSGGWRMMIGPTGASVGHPIKIGADRAAPGVNVLANRLKSSDSRANICF
jgi:hypothetical protein